MEQEQAEEFAGSILLAERRFSDDPRAFSNAAGQLAGTFQALLPQLDTEAAAVVTLVNAVSHVERIALVALVDNAIYTAHLQGEIAEGATLPTAVVTRHTADEWSVPYVAEGVRLDHGGQRATRAWTLKLGEDVEVFKVEGMVLTEPRPEDDDKLGKALACAKGWVIGDRRPVRER